MTARCRHHHTHHRRWTGETWETKTSAGFNCYPGWIVPADCAVVCQDCGAWLSLGPSDETDERVAGEIRALEVAEAFASQGNHDLLDVTSFAERRGYVAGGDTVSGPTTAGEIAGYLARCIAEHEKGQQT